MKSTSNWAKLFPPKKQVVISRRKSGILLPMDLTASFNPISKSSEALKDSFLFSFEEYCFASLSSSSLCFSGK